MATPMDFTADKLSLSLDDIIKTRRHSHKPARTAVKQSPAQSQTPNVNGKKANIARKAKSRASDARQQQFNQRRGLPPPQPQAQIQHNGVSAAGGSKKGRRKKSGEVPTGIRARLGPIGGGVGSRPGAVKAASHTPARKPMASRLSGPPQPEANITITIANDMAQAPAIRETPHYSHTPVHNGFRRQQEKPISNLPAGPSLSSRFAMLSQMSTPPIRKL